MCIPFKINKFVFGPGRLQNGETARVHIEKIRIDETVRKFGANDKYAVFNFTVRNSQGDVVYDIMEYLAAILEFPQGVSEKATNVILS